MAMWAQIRDPEEPVVTIQIGGKYNPDILDDVKRRLVDSYKEALDHRLAIGAAVVVEVEDEGVAEGE